MTTSGFDEFVGKYHMALDEFFRAIQSQRRRCIRIATTPPSPIRLAQ
jgi:hypothetical protein